MIGAARASANAVMDSAFLKSMYAIVFHTAKIALMRTQLSVEVCFRQVLFSRLWATVL